jgi:hypothetical protein
MQQRVLTLSDSVEIYVEAKVEIFLWIPCTPYFLFNVILFYMGQLETFVIFNICFIYTTDIM